MTSLLLFLIPVTNQESYEAALTVFTKVALVFLASFLAKHTALKRCKVDKMMVIWRTTARTGFALGTRTISSSPVKAQAVDFSKAVEDFKANGVAILPLKMEEEYITKSRCFM